MSEMLPECKVLFEAVGKRFDALHEDIREIKTDVRQTNKTIHNGLSERVSSHGAQLKVQWWFLGAVIAGFVGVVIRGITM